MSALDRAWARRPFVVPARWAPIRAVSTLWTETMVAFSRSAPTPTPGGGYDRTNTAPDIFLMAYCHCEITEADAPSAMPGGESLVVARWWTIFLPIIINDAPLDPSNYPKKGDRVRFTDDLGHTISMDIRAVDSPETVADHFEILTETFE